MTFIKIINTILNTNIKPFINNGIFRYSHHHSLQDDYLKIIPKTNIPRTNIIINLFLINLYLHIVSFNIPFIIKYFLKYNYLY